MTNHPNRSPIRPMPDRVYRSYRSGKFFTRLETSEDPHMLPGHSYYGCVGLDIEPQAWGAGWMGDALVEDVSDRYQYFAGNIDGDAHHFVRPRS